ncbi:glycosyltransferase family 4 protein [Mediterraneibacter gnavus]|uniref:glycosyltransferase family 4 protein n=1 Tax=Mediterraneibacter gnavus TaxID=33038 RepID=UPI0036D2FE71
MENNREEFEIMKILYTASVLSHICQFHLPVMEMLQKEGHEIHVAAKNNLAEKNGLQLEFTDRYIEIPIQRSPKDRRNIEAYKKLKKLFQEEYYDVVICNTPVAGVLTRMAAKETRKRGTTVIYMAHGFHFYKGAPKKYWLIYPIERYFANRRTDILITINKEDFQRAKKDFCCTVKHIYGVGVRIDRYHPAEFEQQMQMRRNEGVEENDFVIICSKELMFDNNQKTLFRAVALIKNKVPNMKVLIAGNGPDEEMLRKLAVELKIDDIVRFLGYRTDLEKVVPMANLVVSCSYREGMPLNIIEAMLCARPIIASHNRGHNELIEEGKTGYLYDMLDEKMLADYIMKIVQNPKKAIEFGERAYEKVQNYTSDEVVKQMKKIIDDLGGK